MQKKKNRKCEQLEEKSIKKNHEMIEIMKLVHELFKTAITNIFKFIKENSDKSGRYKNNKMKYQILKNIILEVEKNDNIGLTAAQSLLKKKISELEDKIYLSRFHKVDSPKQTLPKTKHRENERQRNMKKNTMQCVQY